MAKPKVATSIPSVALEPRDELVMRFNELNRTIVGKLPQIARAYDVLAQHVPMLREMQALLSQRPKGSAGASFRMLQSIAGSKQRMATAVGTRYELPLWSHWVSEYARAIDYSVRHIRRLVMNEPPRGKMVKECGWSVSDHNHLIRAATLAFDLVSAIEAGADTAALVQEVKEIMDNAPELDKAYEPKRIPACRRSGARPVTTEATGDICPEFGMP